MKTSDFPCNAEGTLVERLSQLSDVRPDRIGFRFLPDRAGAEATLTFRELHTRAFGLAARLAEIARPGDRALLVHPPGVEFHVAFLACLYAGVVAVPAYPPGVRDKRPDKNMNRVAAIIADCKPVVAITSADKLAALTAMLGGAFASAAGELRVLASDEVSDEEVPTFRSPEITPDTVAFLQYTSGSTANPKGVILTHRNILKNQEVIGRKCQLDSDTRLVSWLPVYHDMGLACALFQPLYQGAETTLLSPLSFLMHPGRWLAAISKYGGTLSGAPNFAYDLCVSRLSEAEIDALDLRSWKVAFTGAEPVRAETLARFAAKFARTGFTKDRFYPCYGLAEATLFVSGGTVGAGAKTETVSRRALGERKVSPAVEGSGDETSIVGCGHEHAPHDVRIVSPETHTLVADGGVGEIWVAAESNGLGYWGRDEETRATFQAHIAESGDGPFLRTGDLGFVKNGELFITGRVKDMIILHGANYYPQDIERIVETAHAALAPNASAAFAVDVGSQERLVVVGELARGVDDVSEDVVTEAVRKAVAEALELQVYAVVLLRPGTLPRTSSGKVQRGVCRTKFQTKSLDEVGHAA